MTNLSGGHTVLLRRTLNARTPFDNLKDAHPEAVNSLKLMADRIHNTARDAAENEIVKFSRIGHPKVDNKPDMDPILTEHYGLFVDSARREYPGFENFEQMRGIEELYPAAAGGPVICINTWHESEGHALVLADHTVHHVPLPDLSASAADSLSTRWAKEKSREVLEKLWDVIVGPVLRFILEKVCTSPFDDSIYADGYV